MAKRITIKDITDIKYEDLNSMSLDQLKSYVTVAEKKMYSRMQKAINSSSSSAEAHGYAEYAKVRAKPEELERPSENLPTFKQVNEYRRILNTYKNWFKRQVTTLTKYRKLIHETAERLKIDEEWLNANAESFWKSYNKAIEEKGWKSQYYGSGEAQKDTAKFIIENGGEVDDTTLQKYIKERSTQAYESGIAKENEEDPIQKMLDNRWKNGNQ